MFKAMVSIQGDYFDVESFLREFPVKPLSHYVKGEPTSLEGRNYKTSGARFFFMEDESPAVVLEEVFKYLVDNRDAFADLLPVGEIEPMKLDIFCCVPDYEVSGRHLELPSKLLNIVGDVGMQISIAW